MNLNKNQLNNVYNYCKLNNIIDVNKFIIDCFSQGFNIKKYGLIGDETSVKEVVVEKKVEVPVEVVKEVVVEKKVEVPVENKIYITDDVKVEELNKTIQQMNEEFESERKSLKLRINDLSNNPKKNSSDKEKLLQQTLVKLKKELSLKTEKIVELENKIKQMKKNDQSKGAVYLNNSNLNS